VIRVLLELLHPRLSHKNAFLTLPFSNGVSKSK